MLRLLSYLFIVSFALFSLKAFAIETSWSNGIESQTRLISPFDKNNFQNKFILGLEYKLNQGWKTYWQSSGEGGFPQEIKWVKSKNIKQIEIFWPIPKYFEILGFTSVGYTERVIFPIQIEINDINKETIVDLDINYLTCKEICIPGDASLQLIIPPGKGALTEYYYDIQKALSSVPKKIKENSNNNINFNTKAFKNKKNISIIVSANSKNIIQEPEFFLHSKLGLPVVKPQIKFSSNLKSLEARFDFEKQNFVKNNFMMNFVFKEKQSAFQFDRNIVVKEFSKISFLNNSVIYILIISLIGGIILNIMPCVLPVLSIKVLTVLNQPNDYTKIRKSFLITSAGIIFSFILLALALIFFRFIGINISWGMQFQQPLFLFLIASIILLFSINLFGFFEFRTPQFINDKLWRNFDKYKYGKDFFNGFFATILATPCSAPFVGTAITVAFTQSSYAMISIFIFMGLGMASPYLLISIFPSIAKILPKPGKWMQKVKYFLGILLFGTFIWIISILLNHFNFYDSSSVNNTEWINFSDINLEDLKKENSKSIIFVDITADWCATCQFNKINVINSQEIKKLFEKFEVIKVRGDWTKPNNKIENYLQSFNKFGIPFNVIYIPDEPYFYVLSEILSKKQIKNYIDY